MPTKKIIIEQTTYLDTLLEYIKYYKVELLDFLKYPCGDIGSTEKHIQFIQEHILYINTNLKKDDIIFSITGIPGLLDNSKINIYRPQIQIKTKLFTIEYFIGIFFNKFIIYNNINDYIQIEPSIQTFKILSDNEFQYIIDILQTVTAELTQHNHSFNK